MADKKKKHHSKHRKHHSKHRKHKKHKKRRRRRRSTAPVGLPSVPTLEQNQYWLLHGRIAALENQAMQGGTQRSGGEKQLSRAEEVDIANRVIGENLKKARNRDDARPPENAFGNFLQFSSLYSMYVSLSLQYTESACKLDRIFRWNSRKSEFADVPLWPCGT
eukprot:COSAG02_NODE_12097_length_1598_cov_1.162775_2_plen_162_part_01